jgi:hypothetical protein
MKISRERKKFREIATNILKQLPHAIELETVPRGYNLKILNGAELVEKNMIVVSPRFIRGRAVSVYPNFLHPDNGTNPPSMKKRSFSVDEYETAEEAVPPFLEFLSNYI